MVVEKKRFFPEIKMNVADQAEKKEVVLKLIRQAVQIQLSGDWSAAESIYHSILSIDPGNPDVLHLLGVLHHQTGRTATAIGLFTRAIRISPDTPFYHNSLGSLFKSRGDFFKASRCFQKALRLKPNYADALYNMAGIYHMEGKYSSALNYYQKAVTLSPLFPEALNNMAAALNMLGKYADAVDACKKAVNLRPDYHEAFNNMGNAYKGLGKPTLAIACYQRSLALAGKSADVLCNLANAQQENGEVDAAIKNYQRAIALNPCYGKAHNNLGTAFRSKRKLNEAERQFRKAIELVPGDAEAYHNLGNVYYDKGDFEYAASWYNKAIAINPASIQTHINRGVIFQETGNSDKAIACFKKALELDPENSKAHCHLVHELYHRCQWQGLDEFNARIDDWTERELLSGRRPSEMPFLSLIRRADAAINFKVARRWSQEISKNSVEDHLQAPVNVDLALHPEITIGYLSNNFRNHPTAHLINDIFKLHDRRRFKIHVYSYGQDDGSEYRDRIRKRCDAFIDLGNSDHEDAFRRISGDHVDILVDLVGYMRGNRLEICACRPAPVQVRWLGLAGTTGADFFDYMITDEMVTPESHSPFYSEKFVYMPDTYQVNSQPLRKSTANFSRGDLGLPENGFVFCCFCSNYKIEPVMFRFWMEILKNVPGSVLWLLKSSPVVVENLRREASICGINPERLIFADKVPIEDHLQRIRHADLGIDTRIVNGAATTSDALRAGVPVLTMKGGSFCFPNVRQHSECHRVRGRLLLKPGPLMSNGPLNSENNPLAVQDIKATLKINQHTKPLFDTQCFVQQSGNGLYKNVGAPSKRKGA